MRGGQLRLQETAFLSRSQQSVGNVSRDTVRTYVSDLERERSTLDSCLTRIPYATLIATIMCMIGVGIFCGTMYRGATLSILMFDQVFHQRVIWMETIRMTFAIIGASMAALGVMILCVGFLTTGATRHRVYREWGSRVGGRISCAIFMAITYLLQIAWIVIFCCLVAITFVFTIFWSLCSSERVETQSECIDFRQFDFMFPRNTRPEHMQVCDSQIKVFCKDHVEKAEVMFILASVACALVILSLVHYLMCLSANYAHIRDHEKFQELREMQYLAEPDLASSKDRF